MLYPGNDGMVTVPLGAQLFVVLYQSFSARNHTGYPCALTITIRFPLACKDVNQPKRTNLTIVSPHLHTVLSSIRLEEVWIPSTIDDHGRD